MKRPSKGTSPQRHVGLAAGSYGQEEADCMRGWQMVPAIRRDALESVISAFNSTYYSTEDNDKIAGQDRLELCPNPTGGVGPTYSMVQ